MPSTKRRLRADDIFGDLDVESLTLLCDTLLHLHQHDEAAFAVELEKVNAKLSKHETGFVRGFFAACLEPVEMGS